MTLSERLSEYVRAAFSGIWVQSFEHDEAVRVGQAFDASVFERRDDVTAALFLPARILDPLDPRDPDGAVAASPEQRSAALLRISRAAVLADRRDGLFVEPDHGSSQNGSER